MKNVITFILLFIVVQIFYSGDIKKPIIKTGSICYSSFYLQKGENKIYPYYFNDLIFFSVKEEFSPYFTLKNKTELYYGSCNKYSDDLFNLQNYNIKNSTILIFSFCKHHKIFLQAKPSGYYKYGLKYFKDYNRIKYQLNLKNFIFSTEYSHQFSINYKEIFYHRFKTSFFWQIPKIKFVKYKTSLLINLQHSINEKLKKPLPLLKNTSVHFEIIFDFNKIDLDSFYKKNEQNTDEQDYLDE